jgi:hypothetical protein
MRNTSSSSLPVLGLLKHVVNTTEQEIHSLPIELPGPFMFTLIFVMYYNNYYTGITHSSSITEQVNLRFKNCCADYMPNYNPNDAEEPQTMQTLQHTARALCVQEPFPICVP